MEQNYHPTAKKHNINSNGIIICMSEEAPSLSTPLEVVTQTPIAPIQAHLFQSPLHLQLFTPSMLLNHMLLETKLILPLLSCCHVCLS
jgi:hypothetical protein